MEKNLPQEIVKRCRELRKNSTDAERVLWSILRNRQLDNLKFRRQFPIAGYIIDFYCSDARLAIEVDGGGHLEEERIRYDQKRSTVLLTQGIKVIRFYNNQVLNETESVILAIWNEIHTLV